MDKDYIEAQYHLAVLDYKLAKNEDEQWEARHTMARLETLAIELFGTDFQEELRRKELDQPIETSGEAPRRYRQGTDGQMHRSWNGKLPEEFSQQDTLAFMVDTDLRLNGTVSQDTLTALDQAGYLYQDGAVRPKNMQTEQSMGESKKEKDQLQEIMERLESGIMEIFNLAEQSRGKELPELRNSLEVIRSTASGLIKEISENYVALTNEKSAVPDQPKDPESRTSERQNTGKDSSRVYLTLPNKNNEEFKALLQELKQGGAKFDQDSRRWYIDSGANSQGEFNAYIRTYLTLPSMDKDTFKLITQQLKQDGARFDTSKKQWYIDATCDKTKFSAYLPPEPPQEHSSVINDNAIQPLTGENPTELQHAHAWREPAEQKQPVQEQPKERSSVINKLQDTQTKTKYKNRFNDFPQNTYDFNDLEQKLLARELGNNTKQPKQHQHENVI